MVTKMRAEEMGTQSKSGAVADQIEKQRANMDYLRDHYEELLKKYPNHWVMIGEGKVVSADSSPDRLIGKLSRIGTSNKIVYYLASPRKRMLL